MKRFTEIALTPPSEPTIMDQIEAMTQLCMAQGLPYKLYQSAVEPFVGPPSDEYMEDRVAALPENRQRELLGSIKNALRRWETGGVGESLAEQLINNANTDILPGAPINTIDKGVVKPLQAVKRMGNMVFAVDPEHPDKILRVKRDAVAVDQTKSKLRPGTPSKTTPPGPAQPSPALTPKV